MEVQEDPMKMVAAAKLAMSERDFEKTQADFGAEQFAVEVGQIVDTDLVRQTIEQFYTSRGFSCEEKKAPVHDFTLIATLEKNRFRIGVTNDSYLGLVHVTVTDLNSSLWR